MSNFLLRVLTAAVLVPAVGFLLFLDNPLYFCLLVPVVSLLAVHELFRMLRHGGYQPFAAFGYVMVVAMQLAAYTVFKPLEFTGPILVPAVLLTILVTGALLAQFPRGHQDANFSNMCVTLFAVLYVGWLAGFLIRLRGMVEGTQWVFLLLFTTWIFDTAAYAWGVNFGRARLWPQVSPGKTWEGLFGGVVFTVAIVCGVSWLLESFPKLPQVFPSRAGGQFLLLLTLAVCVAAQLGDLVESMIKRTMRVKDSNSLLPGHGGLLDKLDSLLFTAPLMYFAALFAEGSVR